MKAWLLLGAVWIPCALLCGADFEFHPGKVTETRAADGSGRLEVEIWLTGAKAAAIKRLRPVAEKAVDDTGVSLVREGPPAETASGLIITSGKTSQYASVVLRQSARAARTLTELSGSVELYDPAADPSAVLTAGLTASNGVTQTTKDAPAPEVSFTVRLGEKYAAWRKTEDAAWHKVESGPSPFLSDDPKEWLNAMRSLPKFPLTIDEKTVAISLQDPAHRVFDLALQTAEGAAVPKERDWHVVANGVDTQMIILRQTITKGMRVRFTLLTAKNTTRQPFSFQNVPLP